MSRRTIVLLAVLFSRRALLQGLEVDQRSVAVEILAGQRLPHTNPGGFSEFVSPSVGIARSLSRRLEGWIQLQPALMISQPRTQPPTDDRETVWAAVLDIGLRFYPSPADWKCVPFVEVFGGVIGASRRVPAAGTNFNFHAQDGVGLILPLGKRWHPFVAARWYHISNGSLGRRNPSWDYWSVGVGAKVDVKP